MLKEAERLYGLGFAIIWLHPKSKRPIESGWTKGPRKAWDQLKVSYRPGMNMGVRLGAASKVGGGYLSVIDCDVKSVDAGHLTEMEAKLSELSAIGPVVLSGRGNGSRHHYVVTKEPLRPRVWARSPDTVAVIMPSSRPSKRDIEELGAEKVKAGYRLRPAWEISLMGEGQQVVLPPSTHPDSQKQYAWATPIMGVESVKLFVPPAGAPSSTATPAGPIRAFTPAEVSVGDLELLGVSARIVTMVADGEGCEDRSAGIFTACLSMVRAGLTDNEIETVLTDRATFLGAAAFEHAKTTDRGRAAQWVRDYSLRKARQNVDASKVFEAEVVETVLSENEAGAQQAELLEAADWRDKLDRTHPRSGAEPKPTLKNLLLILRNELPGGLFRKNEFSFDEIHGLDTPWGARKGAQIRDVNVLQMKEWLANKHRVEPPKERLDEAVAIIAEENKFHPVKDYLNGLVWDGKERIDTWLRDYMGATAAEPYLGAVSRKFLVAMVARILNPGCKFDTVLILEGQQGVGKSTVGRILAGDLWFSDTLLNIHDKDAVVNIQNNWVVELGELSTLRKSDVESLKSFISTKEDKIRLPYGRRTENLPRHCVFIGTTNNTEYLKDETGNRRFWPVAVKQLNFKRIEEDRDQLLAEAVVAYHLGEQLWLSRPEEVTVAKAEQDARMEQDMWVEILEDFFANEDTTMGGKIMAKEGFKMADLFSDFGPLGRERNDMGNLRRAGVSLRKLGFKKSEKWVDGKNIKVWHL